MKLSPASNVVRIDAATVTDALVSLPVTEDEAARVIDQAVLGIIG